MLTNNNNAPGASIQPTAQTPMLKRVSRVGNLEIKTPEAAQAKPLKLGHSKCPVCGFFLAVDKLESHVNECLDHKPTPILKSNSSSTDSFDTLRPHTSTPTPGNLKLVVGASESTLYCVVCAKDISRFTTVARHNHVNACLDIGVTEILHAKPSKESKIALLEKCLFCSLVFPPSKTIKVKISHIKICSKKNRIPTEHLIGLLSSAPLLKRSRGETLLDFFQCDPQNQQVEPRASPKKVKFSKPVPARRDLLVFEAECSDDDFAPMQIVIDRAQKSSWPSSRQEKQDPNYQLAIAQSESLAMHHDKIDKAAMELAGPLFAEGQAAGEQSNTGKWFKKGKKPVISSLLTAKEAHEALAKKRMLLLGDGSPISEPLVSKQSIIVKESDSSVKRSRKSLWEVAGTPGIEDMPVPTFLAAYQSDSMDIDAQDSSENFKFTTPIVPQEKQLPESPCKEESCTPGPNELVNTTCNVETPDNLTIPPKIFTRNCDSVRLKPFRSSTGTPLVANSPLITSTSSRDTQASTTHSQLIELQSQLDAALAQVDILTVNIKNAHETHAAQLDEQHKRHEQESKETLKMFNMQLRSATDALMQSHERHLHVLREKHLDDLELLFDSIESEKQVIGERLGQEHVLMLEQQKELHEKKVASLNEQLTLEQTARNDSDVDFKCRVELAMQEQPIQVSNMPVCVDLPQSSITPPPIDNTMSDFGTPIKPNNPAIHIPQTSSRKPSITPSRVEWPIVDVDTPLQLSTPAILIPQTEARRQSFLSMLSSPVSQTPIPKSNTAYHEENDLFSQDSNVIIADHVESSQADYSMSSVVGPSQPTIAPEAPAYARMSVAELKKIASKYGVRPGTKSAMVAILTRIWYTVNAGISRDSYASQNISNQPSSSKSNEQPSSRRTTTSAPPVNLLQFFQSNEDIYAKILRFEPIDIGMVMNALRSDPLVKECSKSTLLTFLDRQGIAYAAQSSD